MIGSQPRVSEGVVAISMTHSRLDAATSALDTSKARSLVEGHLRVRFSASIRNGHHVMALVPSSCPVHLEPVNDKIFWQLRLLVFSDLGGGGGRCLEVWYRPETS